MSDLRLVFAGSPPFAAEILDDLVAHDFKPVAVYTQPDRPAGRGRKIQASAVKTSAQGHAIAVEQPATLRDTSVQKVLADYQPDVMVVVAYGLILPGAVLGIPKYGCINVHASLLPRWRGAAPIERAFMAGDTETGICIMQMDEGLDTGPVYERVAVPIADLSIDELEAELAHEGSEALRRLLKLLTIARQTDSPPPTPVPQPEDGATYAHKLIAEDRILDFASTAAELARQINALASRQPVRMAVGDKQMQLISARVSSDPVTQAAGTIKTLSKSGLLIQCATDSLLITRLKFEGGKGTVLDGAGLLNGYASLFASDTPVA